MPDRDPRLLLVHAWLDDVLPGLFAAQGWGDVPPAKLFSPAFAATCILALVSRHGPAQSGTFWAWDGTSIPW